ncbi:unnamed protein product [Caretta caretta]
MEGSKSAQEAKLTALIEALRVGEGKKLTVYTDSRYAFGIVHDYMEVRSHRGFITTTGKPINNMEAVQRLTEAAKLPSELAAVKIKAHNKISSKKQKENYWANKQAKEIAQASPIIICAAVVHEEEVNFQNYMQP